MIVKRVFDLAMALVGLTGLAPVFAAIAVAIKLFDRGPVFFVQSRIGKDGRPFMIYKFRTMRPVHRGPEITIGGDSRITPIGRILRKSKLDELPQLWNVLKGDMSFVGPRPEVAKYVAIYTESQRDVLRLRPGITDPASFAFYDESELLAQAADPERYYRDVLVPEKIRINLAYAAQASLWTDLFLILATVMKGFGLHVDVFKRLSLRGPQFQDLA